MARIATAKAELEGFADLPPAEREAAVEDVVHILETGRKRERSAVEPRESAAGR